jgi:aldehyde dehydrogenase (NAD+)
LASEPLLKKDHPFLTRDPKGLFINGRWVKAVSGKNLDVINPATGKVIAQVAEGDARDIDLAVRAARAAFEGPWSRLKPFDRQNLLLRIADVVDKNFDELSWLETLDMGAPIARTRSFKRWLLQTFRFYAAQALAGYGDTIPNSVPGDFTTFTLRLPLGVVGGIIPWNGPLISQLWSICPTLATGCTLVLKPAEVAPLSSLRMAELMQEAGVPDGVINVVPGRGDTAGAALAMHSDVDKIAFTGSTATGRKIVEASAHNMKRVSVELGGKSPDIVFGDANLDAAVPGAAMGCFNNTGQVCYAGTRLLVERKIHDEFIGRLVAFSSSLRVGDTLDPSTQLGPVISEAQLRRVNEYVGIGVTEGAKLVVGGERLGGDLEGGYFIRPTVFAGVTNQMRIAREEIFGPVLSVIPFDTEEEAVRLSNDTQYGLGGALWTQDVGRAHRLARSIQAGSVWVNCYGVTDPSVGYGGYRMSGYGGKGGPHHIDDYLYTKNVCIAT